MRFEDKAEKDDGKAVWNFIFFKVITLFIGPTACRILLPWPEIEPTPPTVEAWSLNHWITREVSSL